MVIEKKRLVFHHPFNTCNSRIQKAKQNGRNPASRKLHQRLSPHLPRAPHHLHRRRRRRLHPPQEDRAAAEAARQAMEIEEAQKEEQE